MHNGCYKDMYSCESDSTSKADVLLSLSNLCNNLVRQCVAENPTAICPIKQHLNERNDMSGMTGIPDPKGGSTGN